ncbi:MAG: hypothetical protein JJT89_09415 [Nitriliruptoraceae bacterium]|nr:hypothetical protein [Nitriliruptoraceae bacterium]
MSDPGATVGPGDPDTVDDARRPYELTHPRVHPAIADGVSVVLPPDPGPRLDDRARSAGQTWIGWQANLLPGDVSGGRDARDDEELDATVAARAARRRRDPRVGRRRRPG